MKAMQKTVMNKKLAQALIESGMEHFDVGGVVQGPQAPGFAKDVSGVYGGATSIALSPVTGVLNGLTGATTTQNEYAAQLAPTDYTGYGGLISGGTDQVLQGYQRAAEDRRRQQMLEQILFNSATGQGGPSPAEAALAKATGQNVAAQGALIAGTRGGGANAGLLAKQAAQTGGELQQKSAADAAILRANEQIAARQQLQQQQGLINSGNVAQQGVGLNLLQSGANAQNTQNANTIRNYEMAQGINAKTSEENAKALNDRKSGLLKSIPAIGSLFSKGGMVPEHLHKTAKIFYPEHFESGGFVQEYRNSNFSPNQENIDSTKEGIEGIISLSKKSGYKSGGKVSGHSMVKGDSEKNDTELALLSPGEIILPRSITQAKDAPSKAAKFVKHLLEKKHRADYSRIVKSRSRGK